MTKIKLLTLTVAVLAAVWLLAAPFNNDVVWSWAVVALAGALALWQLYRQGSIWYRGRRNPTARRERVLRLLASLMGFFLVSGTALFLCAFQYEAGAKPTGSESGYAFVNAEYLLRSIVCSLDLFMLDIDSNVLDGISRQATLKGLIALQALASFSCTVSLLISLVYARIMAYLRLHWLTRIDSSHNHLFIFFGMNRQSRLLAEDIHRNEGERAVIVFVEKSPVNDEDRGGWDSIVEMFTHRSQTFAEAGDVNACVTFTETKLCDIQDDVLQRKEERDILTDINLKRLRTMIEKLWKQEQPKLHVFFLSDNEDENIRSMSVLALDQTIRAGARKEQDEFAQKQQEIMHFYCQARHNSLNRVIEDVAVEHGLNVSIVDAADLSVRLLRDKESHLPATLMDIDNKLNPTTVRSSFNCLVVGFGLVGQDVFRYLYEFGAFVDASAPQGDTRAPFTCTAVDASMEKMAGHFISSAPALKEQIRNGDIRLLSCDCSSQDFYDLLTPEFCRQLNYVVIAIGSDEAGMTCAIRLFNRIRQQRADLSSLRIFVRSYLQEKEPFMHHIAQHYNQGYNVDREADLKNLPNHDTYKPHPVIIPFGQIKAIYSYDVIINDRFRQEGIKFMEKYAELKNDKVKKWHERHRLATTLPVSLNSLRSLRRKEQQDMANAQHAQTKLYLLRQALGTDHDWKGFIERYFQPDGCSSNTCGKYADIDYPALQPKEKAAIHYLARLEHLRWNASHQMLGYTPPAPSDLLHTCDERTLKHNCLIAWSQLDKESRVVTREQEWDADYKAFDYGVVDTTILLNKEVILSWASPQSGSPQS